MKIQNGYDVLSHMTASMPIAVGSRCKLRLRKYEKVQIEKNTCWLPRDTFSAPMVHSRWPKISNVKSGITIPRNALPSRKRGSGPSLQSRRGSQHARTYAGRPAAPQATSRGRVISDHVHSGTRPRKGIMSLILVEFLLLLLRQLLQRLDLLLLPCDQTSEVIVLGP